MEAQSLGTEIFEPTIYWDKYKKCEQYCNN